MDFTKCQSVWKSYGGSLPKNAIIYDDALYMVKTPRTVCNRSINPNHYVNQIYAEYICCQIIASMGYDVQETLLGTYCSNVAVACKDFVSDDYTLEEFYLIKNSVSDCKYSGKSVDLEDILLAIHKQKIVDANELEAYFWDQFILDAFFGNVDRYNENWGILKNKHTNKGKLAPIYDCASSLDFQLSENEMEILSTDQDKQKAYISSIDSVIHYHGKPINYVAFIKHNPFTGCKDALLKLVNRIDMTQIHTLIETLPHVSATQKQFYQTILETRYQLVLKPQADAYRRSFS